MLPALAAVGGACGLLSGTAGALELGQIQVESALGQPLRASIAYALSRNERLQSYCIYLRPGATDGALPNLSQARITIADGTIMLTSKSPIREPMLALQLTVKCPYTAHLARDYTLMINPAQSVPLQQSPRIERQPRRTTTRAPAPRNGQRPAAAPGTPIAANSRYQVRRGDSLSGIVARIADRPAGLWSAVETIFATNPQAFINSDRDLLIAGSWLTIPDLYTSATRSPPAAVVATDKTPDVVAPAAAAEAEASDSVYSGYQPVAAFDTGFASQPEGAPAALADATAPAGESPALHAGTLHAEMIEPQTATAADTAPVSALSDMRPGDVFVSDPTSSISPIDTAATAGNQPGALRNGWSWLSWLAGSGVLLFIGLMLFGRRIRDWLGSEPIGATAAPARERLTVPPPRRTLATLPVEHIIDQDAPGSRSITLDADLGAGTGLQDGADIDVAQDFGFAATGGHDAETAIELDLQIGEDAAAPAKEITAIIPPLRADQSTILQSEIPPSDSTAEYDMSMIVDATKQALGEAGATTRDLLAVQVAATTPEDFADDGYTVSKEVDYKLLEQDYEEELTQTQALNEEFAKAALSLAERMDPERSRSETAAPIDTYAEIDAELTAQLKTVADPDQTAGLPAGLAENDAYVRSTGDGSDDDETAKNLTLQDDNTSELAVSIEPLKTKKSKAS